MKQTNVILTFLILVISFLKSLFQSVGLFFRSLVTGKPLPVIPENPFLDVCNFILQAGPRSFWKRPTGIKIGRSIATLIAYIFDKDATFQKK